MSLADDILKNISRLKAKLRGDLSPVRAIRAPSSSPIPNVQISARPSPTTQNIQNQSKVNYDEGIKYEQQQPLSSGRHFRAQPLSRPDSNPAGYAPVNEQSNSLMYQIRPDATQNVTARPSSEYAQPPPSSSGDGYFRSQPNVADMQHIPSSLSSYLPELRRFETASAQPAPQYQYPRRDERDVAAIEQLKARIEDLNRTVNDKDRVIMETRLVVEQLSVTNNKLTRDLEVEKANFTTLVKDTVALQQQVSELRSALSTHAYQARLRDAGAAQSRVTDQMVMSELQSTPAPRVTYAVARQPSVAMETQTDAARTHRTQVETVATQADVDDGHKPKPASVSAQPASVSAVVEPSVHATPSQRMEHVNDEAGHRHRTTNTNRLTDLQTVNLSPIQPRDDKDNAQLSAYLNTLAARLSTLKSRRKSFVEAADRTLSVARAMATDGDGDHK